MKIHHIALALTVMTANVSADSSTMDAAIGGGIGGATGAAIGNEVGGRDGAVIGGALGGALGAAIATDDAQHKDTPVNTNYESGERRHKPHASKFCPPGQAKKGRC